MGSAKQRRSRKAGVKAVKRSGDAAALDGAWDAQFDAEFERQSQELEQSGRIMTRVLFFVFLGVAVVMLVVAVLTGMNTSRKLAREQSAVGQVTGLTERKDSNGNTFYYPVVSFEPQNGDRENVQLTEGSWPPSHRVGELVTVLYDPLNPLDARIDSADGTAAFWTWTLVTGILGLAFIGAAALAWFLGRA
jgi:hypothetical protein